jgi:hypothetical protein
MAGYIDQVLPEQTQPATYQEIRTEHQANGVPVSSWRSLVNVGLSLTQYVSEAITTARNIVRTVLRGLFVDSLQEDLAAATPEQYAQIADAAVAFVKSQYQENQQPATATLLRAELTSVLSAPVYVLNPGDMIIGTPATSNSLLYTLAEALRLDPGGRIVGLFQAQSPGSSYNLASGTTIELKTTFVGVSTALPASGARLTVGIGNSSLSLHAGSNLANSNAQVAFRIVVDGPNVAVATVTTATSLGVTTITVHSRSDAGSLPLSTASEIRDLLLSLSADLLTGVQLPAGTDGSGVMALLSAVLLPLADGPIASAGQDIQAATDLLNTAVAKWDTLTVGKGTDDALYYWATQPPTGFVASPVRQCQVLNALKYDGTIKGGWITVLVSGELGPLSLGELAAVDGNFYNPRKFANFAKLTTLNATPKVINVTAAVDYLKSSKLSNADINDAVVAALLALQRRLSMGTQTIDPSLIEATIGTANAAIWKVVLSAPLLPTVLAWNERAVFNVTGMTYTAVLP